MVVKVPPGPYGVLLRRSGMSFFKWQIIEFIAYASVAYLSVRSINKAIHWAKTDIISKLNSVQRSIDNRNNPFKR